MALGKSQVDSTDGQTCPRRPPAPGQPPRGRQDSGDAVTEALGPQTTAAPWFLPSLALLSGHTWLCLGALLVCPGAPGANPGWICCPPASPARNHRFLWSGPNSGAESQSREPGWNAPCAASPPTLRPQEEQESGSVPEPGRTVWERADANPMWVTHSPYRTRIRVRVCRPQAGPRLLRFRLPSRCVTPARSPPGCLHSAPSPRPASSVLAGSGCPARDSDFKAASRPGQEIQAPERRESDVLQVVPAASPEACVQAGHRGQPPRGRS